VLIAAWRVAVDAAESALRAAVGSMDAGTLNEHGARLTEQRQRMARLLQAVAHDQKIASPLLHWLDTPKITSSMLGLPTDVIACVFDLDGVLTTSETVHMDAWARTFDAFLVERAVRLHGDYAPFDRRREYQEHLAGKPRLVGAHAFLASRGIQLPEGSRDDPPTVETVFGLANHKNLMLQRHLEREGVAAYTGSLAYLEGARMLGLRRAVVSASASTESILLSAGLDRLIDEHIDAAAIETERLRPKPAPDSLVAACRRLHVRPAQTVAFETTPVGVAAARAAGARLVVGVDRWGGAGALRASEPDLVVSDLAELLGSSR
jgi:HAD superfamily hydrolase (TIGR01509 family)